MDPALALSERGWCRFDRDDVVLRWVETARSAARAALADPAHAHWLRCDGTWHAGVNILPNDGHGALPGGPALAGAAVDLAQSLYGPLAWDAGQVSAAWPGYPRQGTESDAAFRYRVRRDAAHVDGLKRAGPSNTRILGEPHAFILGLPLSETDPGASPVVVWDGSHRIIGAALQSALSDHSEKDWPGIDLTEIYQSTRRKIFDTCRRVVVHAQPGEAYLIHRQALHGITPWAEGAAAEQGGRMIAYFRPTFADWARWFASD